MSYNTFTAGLVAVVANYGLIKVNGAVGAAQATCIAYVVYFLLTWRTANKLLSNALVYCISVKNLKLAYKKLYVNSSFYYKRRIYILM